MNNTALLLEMRKKKTSHVLHLILSILTAGLWVFIWILCAVSNSIENARLDRKIDNFMALDEK